jgi:EAL domain-containing protein (putative c-di-GMP-specific phosphodiesterase class I)
MSSGSGEWSDPVAYLRGALAQDQFALYCQPIAALGEALAYPIAEVLVRLREEETALLPPGEFLPILEHYGMMPELDRWVVREVLRRLAGGAAFPRFSVNLSRQTIADPAFADFFAAEARASGVAPDRVVFEIEDDDAAAVLDSTRRLCAALGGAGAGVLIDGFGRDPGRLATLALPGVRFVKLHGALTRNLAADDAAAARLQALLKVAAGRGIAAIAECVESREVLARLRAIQVRYAQGFGVAAPRPIDPAPERVPA